MLKLQIEINGYTEGDLEMALKQVRSQVSQGFTSGHNRNDTGNYSFTVSGEEEEVPEEE